MKLEELRQSLRQLKTLLDHAKEQSNSRYWTLMGAAMAVENSHLSTMIEDFATSNNEDTKDLDDAQKIVKTCLHILEEHFREEWR